MRTPSKYRNVRTEYDGRVYDSKAEAERAQEHDLLLRSGATRLWQPQPVVTLFPGYKYVPDFYVETADGRGWYEDVKGAETASFKKHRNLWVMYGPTPLLLLYRRNKGWRTEWVVPRDCDVPLPEEYEWQNLKRCTEDSTVRRK